MREWTQTEQNINNNGGFLYFYTPLCGTCQLAKQMIEIVEQTYQYQFIAVNANHYPNFAQRLKITQVPCILSMQTRAKLYTFANVVNVAHFCQINAEKK
ncbi:MAG: thioredoxin family protein [Culicoidibacterales bacterium]